MRYSALSKNLPFLELTYRSFNYNGCILREKDPWKENHLHSSRGASGFTAIKRLIFESAADFTGMSFFNWRLNALLSRHHKANEKSSIPPRDRTARLPNAT